MAKPRVHMRCPANASTAKNERIIEFGAGTKGTGGLVLFQEQPDGSLRVDVYCCSNVSMVVVDRNVPVWQNGQRVIPTDGFR